MPGPVFLEGDRLCLRLVQQEDAEFMAHNLNDPAMRHGGFERIRTPVSKASLEDSVGESDDAHLFLACHGEEPVGAVILREIDFEGRNAELGYWITPEQQGNGYATEAAELMLTHAFDELGLHKVWARTLEDNEGSERVLEKLGFQQEGVFREHLQGFGGYVDEYRYGLLKPER